MAEPPLPSCGRFRKYNVFSRESDALWMILIHALLVPSGLVGWCISVHAVFIGRGGAASLWHHVGCGFSFFSVGWKVVSVL